MIDFNKELESINKDEEEKEKLDLRTQMRTILSYCKAIDLNAIDKNKYSKKGIFYRVNLDSNTFLDITLLYKKDKECERVGFKIYHLLYKDFENRDKRVAIVFDKFMTVLCKAHSGDGNEVICHRSADEKYFNDAFFYFTREEKDDITVRLDEFKKDLGSLIFTLQNFCKKKEQQQKDINEKEAEAER